MLELIEIFSLRLGLLASFTGASLANHQHPVVVILILAFYPSVFLDIIQKSVYGIGGTRYHVFPLF